LLAVAYAATSFAAPPSGVIEVGDSVSHKFRKPLENGMGLTSLADLRGKPVMLEFWGTR
ncbi:MAG: hypothetical protein ACI841_002950, partial [Planctomycetota bacterium]